MILISFVILLKVRYYFQIYKMLFFFKDFMKTEKA